MSSQFLYTSMYSNTRDAFDYSVFSVPAVFPGPTTDNIICPPHPGNMSHCHPASGDGNAQYAGLYNQMNCFEHSAPLVGIRETFVPIFPAAAGFEMGAGDGAATSHVVSSDSAQATVPPGLVMADGPGLSQYSEPDPFPHIDPYILDLIATEAGMGGLNRAPWLYTPPGQEINNTEQTNGASEDATESEGHTCLLAESSAARAYRLAQPRKSAKASKESWYIEIAFESPREKWDEPPAFAVDRSGPGLQHVFILFTPIKLRRDDIVLHLPDQQRFSDGFWRLETRGGLGTAT
ncbi:predicted protein [Postia placenta Mad-698-R]|uniref:Uncharacterized protein n=1 Tax=Postia placenta MAD-698-R-SB12 TaxID=670580 RepID=A0A1X6N480_9APHY|nr:hypothetical protein POSPLADRAFT_1045624 [Postia placenta MAD-698-R-SB12]EED85845.1 predicted protein [Postia placenta Mad-698-R]OSX63233.1 hypothetical protein POSPLADRAFT_1045624 [Postia placenta MAD-698-R-SB12]